MVVFANPHLPYILSLIIVVLYLSYSQLVVSTITSSTRDFSSVLNNFLLASKVDSNALDIPNCNESLFEVRIFIFVPNSDSVKLPQDFEPSKFISDKIIFPLPLE